MAKQEEKKNTPVIIKRVKKSGHGGHHGGAWKVAYADFVTAMMAFFLLLWLLQVTTDEQKTGIADYFSPASVARSKSGSGGVLGGRTMAREGARLDESSPAGVIVALPPDSGEDPNQTEDVAETGEEAPASESGEASAPVQASAEPETAVSSQLEEFMAMREQEQFAAAEQALRQAIDSVPELQDLVNNLLIDQTPEGMRIQIVDEDGESMFPLGSAQMYGHTEKILALIAGAVEQMPQQIAIKGHTDSAPFTNRKGYSNWELSTDRALSSRRALIKAGLPPERIESVVGLADRVHLDEGDPLSPRNRRISIILLRESAYRPQAAQAPGSGPAQAPAN